MATPPSDVGVGRLDVRFADEADIRKRIAYHELMARKDTLETERLVLAKTSWRDAFFVFRLIGNETVRQHLGGPVPLRRRPLILRSYLDVGPNEIIWTVRIRTTARPIGLISVTKHKDGQESELSFQFHPYAWGQGYAFEAASATLRFVREDLGLQRLIAETQVANVASCRLLERLGMSEQQRLRRYGKEQAIYLTDL
jgi:[ribosomal protein S5]-alanine N-acetyltransferase